MNRPAALAGALALAVAGGCAHLEPPLPVADAQTAARWSTDAATPDAAVAPRQWQAFFDDPALQRLIGIALANNRDLRSAILDVERARAQYRIERADQLPAISADARLDRRGGDAGVSEQYAVSLGLADYEIDLFGRVRNLGEAALQAYLATTEARRASELSLVAELASAWYTLAADGERVRIAQASADNQRAAYALGEQRRALGAISALDLAQIRTQLANAEAELARYRGEVARDRNALVLLLGSDPGELPAAAFAPDRHGVPALPAGLPSETLLRRPDVLGAEHRLRAANADIGAARAAFFPSIRLTADAGTESADFRGLFDAGSRAWTFVPRISLPIFQGGRLRAALGVAQAERDIALAQYERAIQAGFREVADALALGRSLAERIAAQRMLVESAGTALALSKARYEAGQDSYLAVLDAERTLFGARQALVASQLAQPPPSAR